MISESCPICSEKKWRHNAEKNLWLCDSCSPLHGEKIIFPVASAPVAPVAPVASVPMAAAEPSVPCSCGCCRWWLPVGQSDWRCETCSPPPSRSLVARWSDATPRMTSELLVTFCRPWCEFCGGWQGRERNYSDWSSELACATCGAELPEVPRPRVSKETKTEVSK